MDALDRKALSLLMEKGRITWADLGQALGLSAPAAADRVRKLEDHKIIRGYSALVDPEALGHPLLAFVLVSLDDHKKRTAFVNGIRRLPQIIECHHIAGDEDYLLKIRCRGTGDLDRVLVEELKGKLSVSRTRTTIVLNTAKETVSLPVAAEGQD